MSQQQNNLPGKGLLGWLGRQVGHVTKAVKTDVTAPKTVYRNETVEETPHPDNPSVILRRTIVDEAVVKATDKKNA